MRKFVIVLALFLLLPALPVYATEKGWQETGANELKKAMETEDVLVVYPLSRIEYNDLHIKGSVNIPMQKLHKELPKDKSKRIVFYCLGPT
jgi:rhodanese-related sulfurtransferase